MLEGLGVTTGVDMERLLDAVQFLEDALGIRRAFEIVRRSPPPDAGGLKHDGLMMSAVRASRG